MSRSPLELVVASANADKVAEIVAILTPTLGDRVVLVPRPREVAEIDETGTTLEENAILKARTISDATGKAAVADDTGLEVDALDGAPGVYSARYAGAGATYADNVEKLLRALDGRASRSARFRTVAVVAFPDGSDLVASGVADGRIATSPAGSTGFGYDPVFVPDGESRSFAELTPAEKHVVSHRGKAFRQLADLLRSRIE
jgi:XTP/dITP diphosphohydrolase